MTHPLSTIAKRKRIAAMVSEQATRAWGGIPFTLKSCDLHKGEFSLRLEDVETDRGLVSHISVDVCPRGVSFHIKFAAPHLNPGPSWVHRGSKWNHYVWPDYCPDGAFEPMLRAETRRIMKEVKPIPNVTRCDKPDRMAWWLESVA